MLTDTGHAILAVRAGRLARSVVGAVTGGLDFSNYYLSLSSSVEPGAAYVDARKQGAVLGYGQFLTVALNFLIVAPCCSWWSRP